MVVGFAEHRRSQEGDTGALKNQRLAEHQKRRMEGPIPYVLLELLLNEKL